MIIFLYKAPGALKRSTVLSLFNAPGALTLHFSKQGHLLETDFQHKNCTKLIGKLKNFGEVTKYDHLNWKSYGYCNSFRMRPHLLTFEGDG